MPTWVGSRLSSDQISMTNLPKYQPGRLSLAFLPWVGKMSASQSAVMLCGCGVIKAGMVRVWVTGRLSNGSMTCKRGEQGRAPRQKFLGITPPQKKFLILNLKLSNSSHSKRHFFAV